MHFVKRNLYFHIKLNEDWYTIKMNRYFYKVALFITNITAELLSTVFQECSSLSKDISHRRNALNQAMITITSLIKFRCFSEPKSESFPQEYGPRN